MKCVNLMTLLVQCVIAVTLLNIMLSFATIDDSNLIVFHHITLSECELKCAKRPSCIGIGYARTTSLCYLLHTEEELVDTGTKFQRNLVLVRKNNFKNAEALQTSHNCGNQCKSGSWQTCSASGCVNKECPFPGPVPNGRLLGNMNTEFSKRRIVCDTGYVSASNIRQIVCKGGVWSPTPSCYLFALTCAAEEPLLDGPNPVPDSYFTATSEYNANWTAHNARLSTVGPGWLVSNAERATIPPTFYLQVRYHALNTVVRIATKGCNDWVTLYRLAYSEDCVTFSNLLDVAGNNATIPANTADYTVEWNQLPTPVRALCLRVFPLEWEGLPILKLEVYGCPSVSTFGRE